MNRFKPLGAQVHSSCRVVVACGLFAVAGVTATPVAADPFDPPAGFYSTATGTGATLKSQLETIMTTGHIQRTYGNFRDSAAIHDQDPNILTNILLVYDVVSVDATWDAGVTWNREHVWPQSLQPGSASNSSTGHLGDPHALRPATPSVNSSRGNKPFGNFDTTGSFGAVVGGNWFPGDTDKGNIARSLFYSDTRYDSTLTDLSTGLIGDINTLIRWNYTDVPDDFERRRNHAIYDSTLNPSFFTNNRNAYVDHPEFVWSVFGGGNNDSKLYVGGVAPGDGVSATTVDLGQVITGAAVPGTQAVTLNKDGANPTYYSVTAAGEATSSVNGSFNAFDFDPQSTSINVGLSTSTATAGLKTGSVTIDNLDVDGAGTGQGSLDGDDTITVNLSVFDHSEASFNSLSNSDILNIDFGTIALGSGVQSLLTSLFNLEAAVGFTAALDLDSLLGSGDTATLTTDLTTFSGLAAGGSQAFNVMLDTSASGIFNATYTLSVSDEDLLGATAGTSLTLQLLGEVFLGGDANKDGSVTFFDFATLQNNFGLPGGWEQGDFNGTGDITFADFAIQQNNFGMSAAPAAVPEPATLAMLVAGGLALLRRRA